MQGGFFGAILLPTSLLSQSLIPNYQPISGEERAKWFVRSTAGFESLALAGPISAGWGTLWNHPQEYGTHWDGFGKRYGMRLTGVSTGNAMEASLGAIWGEDPRYFRSVDRAFGARVKHIFRNTLMAPDRSGRWRPAYARYAALAGNNFLSNTWRAESEAKASSAVTRTLVGFLGDLGSNAYTEFWPDIKRKIFKK